MRFHIDAGLTSVPIICGGEDPLVDAGSLRLESIVPIDPGDLGWFQFRLRHWGPKWEIDNEAVHWAPIKADDDLRSAAREYLDAWGVESPSVALAPEEPHSVVTYEFSSANAPAIGWARALASKFPGCVVSLRSDTSHCGEYGHDLFLRTSDSPDVINRFTLTPEDMPVSEEGLGECVDENDDSDDPVSAAMRRRAIEMLDEALYRAMQAMSIAACVVERGRAVGPGERLVRDVRQRGMACLAALDDTSFDEVLARPPRTASGYGVVDALMAHRLEEQLGENPGLDELAKDLNGALGSLLTSLSMERGAGGARLARLLGSDAGILVGGQHVAALLACAAISESDRIAFDHMVAHASLTPLSDPVGALKLKASDDSTDALIQTILGIVRDGREGRHMPVEAADHVAEQRRLRSLLMMSGAASTAATAAWGPAERRGLARDVIARGALTSPTRLRRYAEARGLADIEREIKDLGARFPLQAEVEHELTLARQADLMRKTIEAARGGNVAAPAGTDAPNEPTKRRPKPKI